MKESRLTSKDRNLLKGAIRRVFSRSDMRREVLERSKLIGFTDDRYPRVKNWSKCPQCGRQTPTYKMQVDHIKPVIPLDSSLEQITWDTFIEENLWCGKENLLAICEICHADKTASENKKRREFKKNRGKKSE